MLAPLLENMTVTDKVEVIKSQPFLAKGKNMRYSGIGGQAVMEGVMMKNQEKYAVAVRVPNQEIVVEVSDYQGIVQNKKIRNMPIFRGVFSFIESLTLGIRALTFSASFFDEEDAKEMTKKQEDMMMGGTVALSHCAGGGDIYDTALLYFCIFRALSCVRYACGAVGGDHPAGDLYRVCGRHFVDAGYQACVYVSRSGAQMHQLY